MSTSQPSFSSPGLPFSLRQHRRLSLLQQFMLLSGLILLLGAGAVGWWIDRRIVAEVIAASVRVGTIYVDSTITPHVWELEDVSHISGVQRAHLDQLLSNNIRSQEFAAFNVWLPNGSLVYSNPPATIDAAANTGLLRARGGEVFTNRTDHIAGHPPRAGEAFLETYFPIRNQAGDEIIAIVSFYQRLQRLQATALQARLQSWLVVGVATLLMYVVLFGLVKRGNDTIARQQRDLARSRRQIQQAAVRAAALNEASLRRLGSDLHDGPAQDLGIALMRMEPLRAAIESHAAAHGQQPLDVESVAFDLKLVHTALQSSLQEVRDLARGLRLPELAGLDLAGTVRKAVADYTGKTGRQVEVGGPASLPGDAALKSAAYRFVQETLNNGHLHADPGRQWLRFQGSRDLILLEVGDDGRGFDPRSTTEGTRRQLGLAGLQERAEILGGRLSIDAAPGRGTVVRMTLPRRDVDPNSGAA